MKRPSSFLKNLQFLNLNIKAKEIRDWVMTLSVWLLTHFRCVWLFVTLWTVAHHVPLSMEFSRQEYWSGFSCPMGSSQPKNQTCFSYKEGNGNLHQCSCLENPRDGGAWWASIYGVSQSWTWLKWLSSSSIFRIYVNI